MSTVFSVLPMKPLVARRRATAGMVVCLSGLFLLLGGWVPFDASARPFVGTAPEHPAVATTLKETRTTFGPRRRARVEGLFGVPFVAAFAPVLSVTKDDTLLNDDGDGLADPGETIRYAVVIANDPGAMDATSVAFSDTVDPNTTLVAGSDNASPIAFDNAATVPPPSTETITLSAADADGDNLTFAIISPPAQGSLSAITPTGPITATVDYTAPASPSAPTDPFTFSVTDDSGRSNATSNEVATVTVMLTNVAPVLAAIETTPIAYTEGDGAVGVTGTLTVSDNSAIATATVSITAGFETSQDVLAVPSCPVTTCSYSAAAGVLTLSGTASVAVYEALLRSVTYENTSMNPSKGTQTQAALVAGPRDITFQVTDDGVPPPSMMSNTAVRTITITPVNDAPVVTTTGGTTPFVEDAGPVAVDAAVTVTDVDSPTLASATVTITNVLDAGLETLAATATGAIAAGDISYAAPTLTISPAAAAPLADFEAVLQSLTYENTSNAPDETDRVVAFEVNDGALPSNVAQQTVSVTSVNDPPIADDESYANLPVNVLLEVQPTASGAVAVHVADNVLTGDTDVDGPGPLSVTEVDGNAGAIGTGFTLASGGTVTMQSDGTFTYVSEVGEDQTSDSFTYTVDDGAGATAMGTVTITFTATTLWFVDATPAALPKQGGTGVLAGTGQSTSPFTDVGSFNGATTGSGDVVFVFAGTYTDAGFTLQASQTLLGEEAGLTDGDLTIAAGTAPVLAPTTGNGVNLASGNTVRGLDVDDTPGGAGFSGTTVGTLTISAVAITGSGAALSIDGGTLSMTLDAITSTSTSGGATAIDLNNVGGTFTVTGATTLDGSSGDGIEITNSVSGAMFSFAAVDIGQTTAVTGAGVELTSNNGSTFGFASLDIRTNAGAGLLTNDPGTVTISGTTNTVAATGGAALDLTAMTIPGGGWIFGTLSSTNSAGAGVSLSNVSGSITGTGGAINGSTGTGFSVHGGSVGVTYGGSITKTSGGSAVGVQGGHTGTLVFETGTVSATAGDGLQFNNADGVYTLNGTVTLNGGDAGIDILNGSGGTFTFSSSTAITNPSGDGVHIDGGGGQVDYNGTITNSANNAVEVRNRTGNTVTFAGSIDDNGAGVLLNSNTGGTIHFTGGLALDTGSNPAFTATNGGTVNVSGTNTIGAATAVGATAVEIDGISTSTGITFSSIASSGSGSEGIDINNLDGAGPFIVTGMTTITNASAEGIEITDSDVSFGFGDVAINTRNTTGIWIDDADGATVGFGNVDIPNPNNATGYGIRIDNSTAAFTFASTDISDTNQGTATTDAGSDGVPDNDGDGDAIFLKNNTGSFTLNGGVLDDLETDGIDVRSSSNITITGVAISDIGTNSGNVNPTNDNGIFALDISGTNLFQNSTIERFRSGGAAGQDDSGIKILNIGTSFTEIRVDNVTFDNDVDAGLLGNRGFEFTARGAVNGSVVVENSNFLQLAGDAIGISNGNSNGSGTLTVTLDNNTLDNSPSPPVGSFGGIQMGVIGTATMNVDITDNALDDLYPSNANNGMIGITAQEDGNLIADIDGNFLSNTAGRTGIWLTAGNTGTATDDPDSFDVTINDNDFSNINDEGIHVDIRGSALNAGNAGNVRITNNRIGDDGMGGLQPVGNGGFEIGVFLRVRDDAKTVNFLIDNNRIRNADASAGDETLDLDVEDNVTVNATITNNTIISQNGNQTADTDITTEDAGATLCLDLRSNTALRNTGGPGGNYQLNETAGVFAVEGSGTGTVTAGQMQGAPHNNSGAFIISGTPTNNNNANCATPPLMIASNLGDNTVEAPADEETALPGFEGSEESVRSSSQVADARSGMIVGRAGLTRVEPQPLEPVATLDEARPAQRLHTVETANPQAESTPLRRMAIAALDTMPSGSLRSESLTLRMAESPSVAWALPSPAGAALPDIVVEEHPVAALSLETLMALDTMRPHALPDPSEPETPQPRFTHSIPEPLLLASADTDLATMARLFEDPPQIRLPTMRAIAAAFPQRRLPCTAGTCTWTIGNLPAGRSVTLVFDATVNNPFPVGIPEISNQGTLTADDGTGGTLTLLSDDPNTGTAADPTTTDVDNPAKVVLNEIDYRQPDPAAPDVAEFIELKNTGTVGVDLSQLDLVLVDGAGPSIYQTLALSGTLSPGAYFVVCADAASVMACDLDVSPDADLIQNGSPDAVALVTNTAATVYIHDALSYDGVTGAPYTEGAVGAPADPPGVGAPPDPDDQKGLARIDTGGTDGIDTDDNAVDFRVACVTPGMANTLLSQNCAMPIFAVTKDDVLLGGGSTASFGDTLRYTIEIDNSGGTGLATVFTDTLDANLALVTGSVTTSQGTLTRGNTAGDADVGVDLGDVVNTSGGAPVVIMFEAVIGVLPAGVDSVSNQGFLTASNLMGLRVATDDPATAAPGDATVTAVDGSADLSLSKTAGSATPDYGAEVVFTLVVSNAGPNTSTAVVTDVLPSGLVYVSDDGGGAYNAATGRWTVPPVAPGGSDTLRITATVATLETVTNTAEVTQAGRPDPDSTPGDGTGDDYAQATLTPVAADLALAKAITAFSGEAGTEPDSVTATFLLTVTNHGPSTATGVLVNDPGPEASVFEGATARQGTYDPATGLWSVGTLAVGTSATLVISFSGAGGNHLLNLATASSDQVDPHAENNLAGARGQHDPSDPDRLRADLSLSKTADVTEAVVGQEVRYTLRLENAGPSTTAGVVVSELLPAGLVFVEATVLSEAGPCLGCGYEAAAGRWVIGHLAVGSAAVLEIRALVEGEGTIENRAYVLESHLPDVDSQVGNADLEEDDAAAAVVVVTSGKATSSEAGDVPLSYELGGNYPNPFNPETVIPFGVPEPGWVRLEVFDMMGRRVALLVDAGVSAGRHRVVWQAGDSPSGVYVVRLTAGRVQQTRRVTLLK